MKKNNFKNIKFLFFLMFLNIIIFLIPLRSKIFRAKNSTLLFKINRVEAIVDSEKILSSDVEKKIFFIMLDLKMNKKNINYDENFIHYKALMMLVEESLLLQRIDKQTILKYTNKVHSDIIDMLKKKKILNEKKFYKFSMKINQNTFFTYKDYLEQVGKHLFLEYFKKEIVFSNIKISPKEYNKLFKKIEFSKKSECFVNCSFFILNSSEVNDSVFLFDNNILLDQYKLNKQFNFLKKNFCLKNKNISMMFLEKFFKKKINFDTKNFIFLPYKNKDKIIFLKINYIENKYKNISEKKYEICHIFIRQDEYDNHSDEYFKTKIYRIFSLIKKNKISFEEAVKKYSNDVRTKKNGSLGWFTKEEIESYFLDFLLNKKKNYISKPFHSENGWHIFKIYNIKKINVFKKYINLKLYEKLFRIQYNRIINNYIKMCKKNTYIKIFYKNKFQKKFKDKQKFKKKIFFNSLNLFKNN